MLSICIGVKDRSLVKTENGHVLTLFPNCIDSIVNASLQLNFPIEIVIVDYNSIDNPIKNWIYDKIKSGNNISVKIISISHDEEYSRGKAKNLAGDNSTYENLFFCDTDMLVNADVLKKGIYHCTNDSTYFPICFSYADEKHNNGWWRDAGWGMVFVKKTLWSRYKIPEYFVWGKEDGDFKDLIKNETVIVRDICKGLYHQWHPIDKNSTTIGIQKIK